MGKVTRLPNPLDRVEATIRRLAQDSANVHMTKHAWEMLEKRGRTMTEVYMCLQFGELFYGPILNSEHQQGYKCRMRILSAGECMQVTCKLVDSGNEYIIVITVI